MDLIDDHQIVHLLILYGLHLIPISDEVVDRPMVVVMEINS